MRDSIAGLTIVQCYGVCRKFMSLIGSWFHEGHVFCETDKPKGAIQITRQNLAITYPAEVNDEE